MAEFQCGLCSYIYDEVKEGVPWDDLPKDWVCPVCGSPKSAFFKIEKNSIHKENSSQSQKTIINSYQCELCSYIYSEGKEETLWGKLPDDWLCPVCGSAKKQFIHIESHPETENVVSDNILVDKEYLEEWQRPRDDFEIHMSDIHTIASSGASVLEPMRSQIPTFSWNDIIIKGAQLRSLPLNKSQPVKTQTTIGPEAKVPLVINMPLLVAHMSFGALSREAKLALAKGSSLVKTAMSSGEGGILPESLDSAYRYIFEYVPNKYSATDDNLKKVDAVEIKIGQSAKPGMGGHLPGNKVTKEIARIRGKREGKDIISPSRFPDILSPKDLKKTVDRLREKTFGRPIGIKIAAGHLKEDIEIALSAGIDFITIDGREGGTGVAPKVVKNATSVPTIFALANARKVLNAMNAHSVSLIITGGLRVSSDFIKALAMGADAIALGTSAMMALGCQQYRICNTGRCPVGIATQDPVLRSRLDVEKSSLRIRNFFHICNEELKEFARLTGHDSVHHLTMNDVCTCNSEISNYIGIEHV